MKKMATFALAASMLLGTRTFAGTITTGNQNIDVEAKYQDKTTSATVYSVDISWGKMQFVYTESGNRTWNPSSHMYAEKTTSGWNAVGNTVSVTNHSNADVTTSFAFSALGAYSTVNGKFDISSKKLAAGIIGDYENADKVTSTLTLSGELSKNVTNFTKIGAITVTVQ